MFIQKFVLVAILFSVVVGCSSKEELKCNNPVVLDRLVEMEMEDYRDKDYSKYMDMEIVNSRLTGKDESIKLIQCTATNKVSFTRKSSEGGFKDADLQLDYSVQRTEDGDLWIQTYYQNPLL